MNDCICPACLEEFENFVKIFGNRAEEARELYYRLEALRDLRRARQVTETRERTDFLVGHPELVLYFQI